MVNIHSGRLFVFRYPSRSGETVRAICKNRYPSFVVAESTRSNFEELAVILNGVLFDAVIVVAHPKIKDAATAVNAVARPRRNPVCIV
jgi:hypothetical protein